MTISLYTKHSLFRSPFCDIWNLFLRSVPVDWAVEWYLLKSRAVPRIVILHQRGIGFIPGSGDTPFFYSLLDSTSGFVQVGAVEEAALVQHPEDFGEIVGNFRFFHIDDPKSADAGGIDQVTVCRKLVHLSKSRGMFALLMVLGYFVGL